MARDALANHDENTISYHWPAVYFEFFLTADCSPCPYYDSLCPTTATYILTFCTTRRHSTIPRLEIRPSRRLSCLYCLRYSIYSLDLTADYLCIANGWVFLLKQMTKHIFVYIKRTRLDVVQENHHSHENISWTPVQGVQIRKKSMVRSQHHCRP